MKKMRLTLNGVRLLERSGVTRFFNACFKQITETALLYPEQHKEIRKVGTDLADVEEAFGKDRQPRMFPLGTLTFKIEVVE
jgi:hypothetical protein